MLVLILGWLGALPLPAQAQAVDLVHLFNSGVNLGWLGASLEAGMYKENHEAWAANTAAHFNAGYSLKDISPPDTIQSSVSYTWSNIRHTLSSHAPGTIGPALTVFRAGMHLGTGQIWAQKGTCPDCVRNMLQRAGIRINNAGASLHSAAIRSRGQRLKDLWTTFQANNKAQVQAYEPEFATAIAFMQANL